MKIITIKKLIHIFAIFIFSFLLMFGNAVQATTATWSTFTTSTEPTITSLSPSIGTQGENNLDVIITGAGFAFGNTVNFTNSGITINSTTINGVTSITTNISISSTAPTGLGDVTVTNTNGTSNALSFRVITSPFSCLVPTISSISPTWAYVGSSSTTVTINGTNFSNGTTGKYNGTVRTTNFVNSGQINIILTSSDLSSVGTGNITVTNGSNYCTSNTITFSVNSNGGGGGLIPNISSISPSSVVVGSGAITINIFGSNFTNSSYAYFNGGNRSTNFINSGQLVMNLNYSDTSSIGNWNIYVNSGSGNISNSVTFNVYSNNSGGGGGGGGRPIYYVGVITQNASNISKNSVILNGSINPNNNQTTAWFEYGTSYNLGTYNETSHNYFGSAGSYLVLSQNIGNLNPNTTYYFRAVANNYAGTIRGSIFSFTTGINVINNNVNGNGNNTITKIIYQDDNNIVNNSSSNDSAENQTSTNNDYFNGNNLSGNALFGLTNILPKTFLGWIIFLILILITIIIGRKLYEDYSYQKTRNKVDANNINNLPV